MTNSFSVLGNGDTAGGVASRAGCSSSVVIVCVGIGDSETSTFCVISSACTGCERSLSAKGVSVGNGDSLGNGTSAGTGGSNGDCESKGDGASAGDSDTSNSDGSGDLQRGEEDSTFSIGESEGIRDSLGIGDARCNDS